MVWFGKRDSRTRTWAFLPSSLLYMTLCHFNNAIRGTLDMLRQVRTSLLLNQSLSHNSLTAHCGSLLSQYWPCKTSLKKKIGATWATADEKKSQEDMSFKSKDCSPYKCALCEIYVVGSWTQWRRDPVVLNLKFLLLLKLHNTVSFLLTIGGPWWWWNCAGSVFVLETLVAIRCFKSVMLIFAELFFFFTILP